MATAQFLSLNASAPAAVTAAVDDAVRRLFSVDVLNGRWRISLPVVCCTGIRVDVTVWPEGGGDSFLVTDDGLASKEIENGFFSERSFQRIAKERCTRYGALFDGQTMLFMRVGSEQLHGAIIAMANLTKEVVDETVEHSLRVKHESGLEKLVSRLGSAFPTAQIDINAKIVGQSTAEHEFDALVRTDRGLLAFDLFSKDGNSVNAAYTKLSDIARLDHGPKPIGITKSTAAIGPKLTLITSVADVLEIDAPVKLYGSLAA